MLVDADSPNKPATVLVPNWKDDGALELEPNVCPKRLPPVLEPNTNFVDPLLNIEADGAG